MVMEQQHALIAPIIFTAHAHATCNWAPFVHLSQHGHVCLQTQADSDTATFYAELVGVATTAQDGNHTTDQSLPQHRNRPAATATGLPSSTQPLDAAADAGSNTTEAGILADKQQTDVVIHAPTATGAKASGQPGTAAAQEPVKYGIDSGNVGYQLLKRAGWVEGTGLGASGQCSKTPLQPSSVEGAAQGIGYAQAQQWSQPHRPSKRSAIGTTNSTPTSQPQSTHVSNTSSTAQQAGGAAAVKYAIDGDNIGFRLLRKAGWQEGTGLGAAGHGPTVPLQPAQQKGNRGIGYTTSQNPNQSSSVLATRKRVVHGGADVSTEHQQLIGPSIGSSRVREIVKNELAAETTEVKVKRHKQVARQEQSDKRARAIQSYLFRAFNEPSTATGSDSNPISRPSRLTATNPLLD
eukprot:jgi/Chrzof1/12232/Cz06g26130.t1